MRPGLEKKDPKSQQFWISIWLMVLVASIVIATADTKYILIGSLQPKEFCGQVSRVEVVGRALSLQVTLRGGAESMKFYVTAAPEQRRLIMNSDSKLACAMYDERLEGGGHTWFHWAGFTAFSFEVDGRQMVNQDRMREHKNFNIKKTLFSLSVCAICALVGVVWLIKKIKRRGDL